jgi:hypothetical protein
MALLQKLKIGTSLALAAVITLVVSVMAYLINLSGASVSVQPLFALGPIPIDPVSPFTSTPYNTVLGFLSGILPIGGLFDFNTLLPIFLSAFLIVWAGALVMGFIPRPSLFKGKLAQSEGVFWTILAGTLVFYLIIVGFSMAPTAIIGGLLLYVAVVSIVTTWAASMLKIRL